MRKKRSLKQINIFSFSLIIFTVILAVLLIVYYQKGVISDRMISLAEKELVEDIEKEFDHFFEIPELTISTQEQILELEALDFNDDAALSKYFASVINSMPTYIYSYSYGLENGEYYGARRVSPS